MPLFVSINLILVLSVYLVIGSTRVSLRIFRLATPLWFCFLPFVNAQEMLQTFESCRFVDEPWADGDSFPVRFPDGKVRTVRLYGVDCLESQVAGSDSNAQRLRDQRRWFGLPDMDTALQMGLAGKEATRSLLAKGFTVHTAFADARGDTRYSRIYGFVTLPNGTDLSEHLVAAGYARAFGVSRARPDGTRGDEWKQQLLDLELRAAKLGVGAWALTDWDRLTSERRAARQEMAEIASVQGRGNKGPSSPLDPNTASRDELLLLPGVGEIMALKIIEGRPYRQLEDLRSVNGIGSKTLDELKPHLMFPSKTGRFNK